MIIGFFSFLHTCMDGLFLFLGFSIIFLRTCVNGNPSLIVERRLGDSGWKS